MIADRGQAGRAVEGEQVDETANFVPCMIAVLNFKKRASPETTCFLRSEAWLLSDIPTTLKGLT